MNIEIIGVDKTGFTFLLDGTGSHANHTCKYIVFCDASNKILQKSKLLQRKYGCGALDDVQRRLIYLMCPGLAG